MEKFQRSISIWKNVQFLLPLENANQNQTGIPSHPSENGYYLEKKYNKKLNTGEYVGNASTLSGGM